nr:immunoglobulin light chain junction region [Macaca mulatta]
YMQGTQLPLTF